MGLNGKKHRRNLLQIVIGGSGAGKTRFFCKPNLMQANCSFLVTDPKGEMLRAVAPLLIQKGYVCLLYTSAEGTPPPKQTAAFYPAEVKMCIRDRSRPVLTRKKPFMQKY